jgi:hypothetical protein
MPSDQTSARMSAILEGARLLAVARGRREQWSFSFDRADLSVACLWRVTAGERLAFTRDDQGRNFGRPKPANVETMAKELLVGRHVSSVESGAWAADLAIYLGAGLRLELLVDSASQEAWQLNLDDAIFVGAGHRIHEVRQSEPGVWAPTRAR